MVCVRRKDVDPLLHPFLTSPASNVDLRKTDMRPRNTPDKSCAALHDDEGYSKEAVIFVRTCNPFAPVTQERTVTSPPPFLTLRVTDTWHEASANATPSDTLRRVPATVPPQSRPAAPIDPYQDTSNLAGRIPRLPLRIMFRQHTRTMIYVFRCYTRSGVGHSLSVNLNRIWY